MSEPLSPIESLAARKGICPTTGKRVYYKARLASQAVETAAKRGELPPMRHYVCPHCGWWHLSSQPLRTPTR